MSLFFDEAWFDGRLVERGLDRTALAASAGLSREELHQIICNRREASQAELTAFAALLGADMIEISLRSGIALRGPAPEGENPAARLDDLDARLDRVDRWLDELTGREAPGRDDCSPSLSRASKRA